MEISGSRENILKAKIEILEGMDKEGTVIINNDNDLLNRWYTKQRKYKVCTYGIDNNSDYMAYNIRLSAGGSTFKVDVDDKTYNIEVPIGGMHFVYNSLCAIATGRLFNIEMENIAKGIETFNLTSQRMEIQKISNNVTVINDSYNASYDSMKAALEVLKQGKADKKIAVLGDMLELGKYTQELHEKVGEEVVKNNIDVLITVGESARYIYEKAKELGMDRIYLCRDTDEVIRTLKKEFSTTNIILFKASKIMNFSSILDRLKENI